MFTLNEPSESDISNLISSQSNLPFSYAEVGATQGNAPAGYTVDHNHIQLGRGGDVFERAVEALRQWRQFDLGWVTIATRGVKLEKDAVVAVKAWACGLWSLNACRVIYVIDEQEPLTRFGFAYGTLPDHIERGEERFLIEWNRSNDSVWYDILAFSQPRHPLVKLGFPVARVMQKRFARDSLARMRSVVAHP
ncbi:MAG TPA: DUF1990 domain-containing protein [Pyrinomonadaceae bacterium]